MKKSYKGFELVASRQKDMMGGLSTYGSVHRESDGWELTSEGPAGYSIPEMMEELVYAVDDYLKNPKPYEE